MEQVTENSNQEVLEPQEPEEGSGRGRWTRMIVQGYASGAVHWAWAGAPTALLCGTSERTWLFAETPLDVDCRICLGIIDRRTLHGLPEGRTVLKEEVYGRVVIVVNAVAAMFALDVEEVRHASRGNRFARPRRLVAYVLREKYRVTFPKIGAVLNVHHSTAIRMVRYMNNHWDGKAKKQVETILRHVAAWATPAGGAR